MPELLEGRTTGPATWMRTPENLARFAALNREADARRRAITDREEPLTDLHEPLEPLDNYPDELPSPRQHGDVNVVGLLSVAGSAAAGVRGLRPSSRLAIRSPRHRIRPFRPFSGDGLTRHAAVKTREHRGPW
ncbi:hypothetical protein ACFY2M_35250 [Streptomyces sp. NPDC001276]|uniref:hypothetical protein n=1 Tax=Streptomyces sp. NPDC001276 TaxID=3364555 RepID=UPI003690B554